MSATRGINTAFISSRLRGVNEMASKVPGDAKKVISYKESSKYSKSPRIRTYFYESQAEIGSYFKDTKTNFKV